MMADVPTPSFWRTLRKDPMLRVAIFCIVLAIGVWFLTGTAGATDVTVNQGAKCVNAEIGRYDVTVSAHNTYDKVLHVTVNNPASPIGLTLQPGQTWSYPFHVSDYAPWKVTFTTTDAILIGETSHTWTFTEVCGAPEPTTTTPPPTDCAHANPPRTDCGPTPPSTALPPVTTVVEPTTVAPPATSAPDVTSAPPPPQTAVQRVTPTTVCRNDVTVDKPLKQGETVCSLPTTGDESTTLGLIAAIMVIVGAGLITIGMRRHADDQ